MRRNALSTLVFLLALAIPLMGAEGCGDKDTSDTTQEQREQTQEMTAQAHDKVGMPQITEYSERRLLKRIMELRDGEIGTHSYLVGEDNSVTKMCRSVGYGLPYGVQFVNPQKSVAIHEIHGDGVVTLPQADPNGLFSPRNVDATWVNCLTTSGEQQPIYTEERVITSPVPLEDLQGTELR